jgi:hypothetical protein
VRGKEVSCQAARYPPTAGLPADGSLFSIL